LSTLLLHFYKYTFIQSGIETVDLQVVTSILQYNHYIKYTLKCIFQLDLSILKMKF